jgi:hypothetical protein
MTLTITWFHSFLPDGLDYWRLGFIFRQAKALASVIQLNCQVVLAVAHLQFIDKQITLFLW